MGLDADDPAHELRRSPRWRVRASPCSGIGRKGRNLDRVAAGELPSKGAIPPQQLQVVGICELAPPAASVRNGTAPPRYASDGDAERPLRPTDEEQRRRLVAAVEVGERLFAGAEGVDAAEVVRGWARPVHAAASPQRAARGP